MSELFHSLLKTCERKITGKRALPSVSFEYEPYIQTNRIQELVRHSEFPTVRNHALCYAAAHSNVDTLKTLLNSGSDFTTGDALYAAAQSGNMSVVQFLVEIERVRVYSHHIYATYEGDHLDVQNYLIEKYTEMCDEKYAY